MFDDALPSLSANSCWMLPLESLTIGTLILDEGTGATVQNGKGVQEQTGLSVLDVTKHAVKTMLQVLGPDDRLSLVKYSDEATVVFELTMMDEGGKTSAVLALENMSPENSTNLWDGLHKGMEVVRNRDGADESRAATIMILTDGQPNLPGRFHHCEPMVRNSERTATSTNSNSKQQHT